ncbi:type II toxin-antitoxin system RelE/ParE family toxin [Pigmentiphaga sp. H8]|uniref:type II toxin-antitoxin system RelE family toxin n=1 Tax=Pigmentiphaga sp. H8 TaxID=2488560 RepID=UPI000F5A4586|nr:type II toxin-antitoxin system RelE/ParE family toxin [Pigmentiphaga sp. H8]AZG07567.1 type II toxin-antitoxin system RelE/ParE family toxin [Pigmentiphaga sp. H8]
MNSILWTVKAARQLRKLDRQHQMAIRDGVSALVTMPDCLHVKALANHQYGYRLRIANYRIFFDWDGKIRIVEIQEVKKRDERTY